MQLLHHIANNTCPHFYMSLCSVPCVCISHFAACISNNLSFTGNNTVGSDKGTSATAERVKEEGAGNVNYST